MTDTALLERATTLLVTAMTTSDDQSWTRVRQACAALSSRARKVVDAELELTRGELLQRPELAGEAVGEWRTKLRRLVEANPRAAEGLRELVRALDERQGGQGAEGGVSNTIIGDVTGIAIQARTINGGAGNTGYQGDHVDQRGARTQRDVTGTQSNHHTRWPRGGR
ncbi:hypothetical protein A6A08_06575 [Nocardiopsis sp. TSRI0078]|uniref:hypothetical protein n=1 Tax=unclassified Nocardiopsis TaxID=2649073 RepID=UPI00095DE0CD|nr:hypothetical protein [Nocardiopsis sp. TSRI0078]OKI16932.1 hypothetical protein A6A08_06575 [Nocardiopsis sp. TSRI0078]